MARQYRTQQLRNTKRNHEEKTIGSVMRFKPLKTNPARRSTPRKKK